jgi:hypothetical protein
VSLFFHLMRLWMFFYIVISSRKILLYLQFKSNKTKWIKFLWPQLPRLPQNLNSQFQGPNCFQLQKIKVDTLVLQQMSQSIIKHSTHPETDMKVHSGQFFPHRQWYPKIIVIEELSFKKIHFYFQLANSNYTSLWGTVWHFNTCIQYITIQ